MTAWFSGIFGVLITWYISTRILGFHTAEALRAILSSVIAGWVALYSILRLEHIVVIRKRVFRGSIGTWVVFSSTYFGVLLALIPQIRDLDHFLILVMPLIMTTGITIVSFGPIQDRWVAKRQRRARLP